MPYEGERSGYHALRRVAADRSVQQLLERARIAKAGAPAPYPTPEPQRAPGAGNATKPDYVLSIDGSYLEVDVETGYPGARVGYVTTACVLLDLRRLTNLDRHRPVDPRDFRKTEQRQTWNAALPGSNVITGANQSARASFREEVYLAFENDLDADTSASDDNGSILQTYEYLLSQRGDPKPIRCPYTEENGCEKYVDIGPGRQSCTCKHRLPLWSTDALRAHERFRLDAPNAEPYNEVMQVWEQLALVHILRWFERKNFVTTLQRLAFFRDGPLAVFGHPAWLAPLIGKEIVRVSTLCRNATGDDLTIIGVEKSGTFVNHFEMIDQTAGHQAVAFAPGTYVVPTDAYIKARIIHQEPGGKPYGEATYFGRKFLYKSARGARLVPTLAYTRPDAPDFDSDDIADLPTFGQACRLLDELVSSQYPNALAPIVAAHAQAALPLNMGTKVLSTLAQHLMADD